MAVFPVTNAEYALFMAAGGYEDERWWQMAARTWNLREGGGPGSANWHATAGVLSELFGRTLLRSQQVSPEQIDFWLWVRNTPLAEVEQQYIDWYVPSMQLLSRDFARQPFPTSPINRLSVLAGLRPMRIAPG